MSFLRAEGHTEAHHYPLSMLWHEVSIARARRNQNSITEAILIQNAVASLLDKKASKGFQKIIKDLSRGD